MTTSDTIVAFPERLLTVRDLAALMQVPVATIYEWRKKGTGPRAYTVGKYIRFRPSDVERWLEQRDAA